MKQASHPSVAPDRSAAVLTLRWMVQVCGTGAAVAAVLMLLIFATEHLPASPSRQHLQQSFDLGALQGEDWPEGDRIRGANQYNDCLLVMMNRFRTSPWSSTVAPIVVFNDHPVPLRHASGKSISECEIARAAVAADDPRGLFGPEIYSPYGRYIHAYRIPFNLLIPFTHVGSIRAVYRATVVLILLATIAAQVVRLTSALRASNTPSAVTAFCFAGIALALLLFSGLDLFAQSLTHGPSDIVLFSAFAWLSLRPHLTTLRTDLEAAALGGLAFAFDFLHGTIPMMLAMLVGCAGLRAFGSGRPVPFSSIVRLVIAFVMGVAAAVTIKLTALLSVVGWAGISDFGGQISYRIGGNDFTLTDVIAALDVSAYQIGWGHRWVAITAIISGIGFALVALGSLISGAIVPKQRLAVLAALSSIAVIFTWYLVFRNHTALHAGFMVRLLAWPIGMGCACLVLAFASTRIRTKSVEGADRT